MERGCKERRNSSAVSYVLLVLLLYPLFFYVFSFIPFAFGIVPFLVFLVV